MLRRNSFDTKGLSFVLAFAAASWIACAPSVDGVGGSGGSGASSHAGGTGAACGGPALVGDLDVCAVDPDPGGGYCGDATLCDSADNLWQAKCDEGGCQCLFNKEEICTCAFDESPCAEAVDDDDCCAYLNSAGCCPYPWLNHPGCGGTGDSCTLNADCCAFLCTDGTCDP